MISDLCPWKPIDEQIALNPLSLDYSDVIERLRTKGVTLDAGLTNAEFKRRQTSTNGCGWRLLTFVRLEDGDTTKKAGQLQPVQETANKIGILSPGVAN